MPRGSSDSALAGSPRRFLSYVRRRADFMVTRAAPDQERRCDDRVLAALRAAAERLDLLRWLAAMRDWTANARRDADARGSRLRARLIAARRLGLASRAADLPWPRA